MGRTDPLADGVTKWLINQLTGIMIQYVYKHIALGALCTAIHEYQLRLSLKTTIDVYLICP